MSIPTGEDILALLARLDSVPADDLETQWLDFKPWQGPKDDMKVAVEYACCFANAEGGVVVFGVADRTRGRAKAIQGASGYDLDVWRRGIFDSTRPNLEVEVTELAVPEGTGRLVMVRVPQGLNPLSYGKRIPEYEADGWVTLRIFDGSFDERMAALVARWRGEGREIGLDGLLVLAYLRETAFLDAAEASELLQLSREAARTILDQLAQPETGFLERHGRTKSATYHLSKGAAKDLLGRAAYTRIRGLNPLRYSELVRELVADHGSITPQECRHLLGLGESQSARVETSRYFKKWSGETGFLQREGGGKHVRYIAR